MYIRDGICIPRCMGMQSRRIFEANMILYTIYWAQVTKLRIMSSSGRMLRSVASLRRARQRCQIVGASITRGPKGLRRAVGAEGTAAAQGVVGNSWHLQPSAQAAFVPLSAKLEGVWLDGDAESNGIAFGESGDSKCQECRHYVKSGGPKPQKAESPSIFPER